MARTKSIKNYDITQTNRYLLNYFFGILPIFTKGSIKFSTKGKDVEIFYHTKEGHSISSIILIDIEDPYSMIDTMQSFVIDCYFYHEWDKQQTKSNILGILLGETPDRTRHILDGIRDKIYSLGIQDGNKFL